MLSRTSVQQSFSTLGRSTCSASATSRRAPRRSALQVRAIGSINDPEKTKANKEKKAKDSEWAEPKNKNPLEKKSIIHGEAGVAGEKGGDVAEGAKDAVDGVVEKAKDAVDGAKKAVSGN